VRCAARDEGEVSGRGIDALVAGEDRHRAGDDVERLVLAVVDVKRRRGAARVVELEVGAATARLRAAGLDGAAVVLQRRERRAEVGAEDPQQPLVVRPEASDLLALEVVGLQNVTAIAPLARRLSSAREPSAAVTPRVSALPSSDTAAPQARVICGRMSASQVATTIAIPPSMKLASSGAIVGAGPLMGADCRVACGPLPVNARSA